MGESQGRAGYQVTFDPEAIGENAGSIRHQQLAGLPENLKGLCRYRVGDYRVLYWLYPQRRELRVYGIIHRRTDYKILRG